jgi:hypothetical protein
VGHQLLPILPSTFQWTGTGACPYIFFIHHLSFIIHHSLLPFTLGTSALTGQTSTQAMHASQGTADGSAFP